MDPRGAPFIVEATRKNAQIHFLNGSNKDIQTIVRYVEIERMTAVPRGTASDGGDSRQLRASPEKGRIMY